MTKRSTNLRGHGPADGGLLGKVGLALRELDAARLRIQELEAELDCGQDTVCAKPPGCRRHWEERNRELRDQRDQAQTLAEERKVSIGHWKAANEETQRERDEAHARLAAVVALVAQWTNRCAAWRAASRTGSPDADVARAYEIAASELGRTLAAKTGGCTCPEEHETHLVGCPLNCGHPDCNSCDRSSNTVAGQADEVRCTCPEEHETHLVVCPLNCGHPDCSSCDRPPKPSGQDRIVRAEQPLPSELADATNCDECHSLDSFGHAPCPRHASAGR